MHRGVHFQNLTWAPVRHLSGRIWSDKIPDDFFINLSWLFP